ncbi:hypothetical protein GSI_05785 [Ganoderma sinense ZZ0214-1]|uniref:F-box domain-containing protein n=1 Tax=Ganoderma sinense ZZ0214-1 TaxID=1077348 RepID=A0A2G8SBF2_9APHY|nr:hypothetical protein GSI_05785 [Ganoderma sinense ZZ0214-1]
MHRFEADLLEQPRLNFDVLRLVCNSLTEIPDILSFALTCSAFAVFAFQRRLRMSPINLSNDEVVDSFHRFIFADKAARAPYIYGLKLPSMHRLRRKESPGSWLQAMHDQLVSILEAAVHLEYMYFPTNLDLDPVLAAAANMTSLRELRIVFEALASFPKWSPWKLLGTFRSPLRSLRIDSSNDSARNEGFSVKLIHDYLANFAPTLEVLEAHSIDFDDFPSPVMTQFTALRSFTIHTVHNFNQSTMEVLLQLFLNLNDTLALGFLGVMGSMEHDHRALREWLHIAVFRSYGRVLLEPVLRDSCPRFLHISLQDIDILHNLDDLFLNTSSEEVDALTHLVVFVDVEVRGSWHAESVRIPSWAQFRDKLIDSVKHLRLTHLRIVFHYAIWWPQQRAIPTHSLTPEQIAVYIADKGDLHTVATRIFDAMPTAQYIFLTTCGHSYPDRHLNEKRTDGLTVLNKWHASKAWRRAAHPLAEGRRELSNAKASPVELSGEATEKIIAQEELYLSSDEEVCTKFVFANC